MADVTYGDLRRGDWFRSPRAAEGWVQVVCPFGTCQHDERDIFSCHIRQTNEWGERVEYFVLADPNDEAHVADSVLERLGERESFSTDCAVCNASESSEVIEYNEGMCESCAIEERLGA